MPVTYGYATTIRRAQGATLELIGIRFDRKLADHGYAYVAVSRARRRVDVYHIGSIRRTDWRPVGEDDRGLGTSELTIRSMSDSEQPESEEPTSRSDPSMSQSPESEDEPEDMDMGETSQGDPEDMDRDESDQEEASRSESEVDACHGCPIVAADTAGLFT